jgi:hypothetical protein
MAIKTAAELKTYFETGDTPTQSQFEDLIDTTVKPYKVYTALLTQEGTNPPDARVLENTLGFEPVWAYDEVGYYKIQNEIFIPEKTFILTDTQKFGSIASGTIHVYAYNDDTTIWVECGKLKVSGANVYLDFQDNILNNLSYSLRIEIRVYN